MNTQLTGSHCSKFKSFMRISAFIAFVALVGFPLFSTSSASSIPLSNMLGKSVSSASASSVRSISSGFSSRQLFGWASNSPSIMNLSPVAETIGTYAADCTTPKTDFILGETVCAKTSGVTETDRFVNWLDPNTAIFSTGPVITTDPETTLLVLPTNAAYVGAWKATIADPTDSSIIPAPFNVMEAPPIATYASDCFTPKTDFVLGDVVCVRVNGLPVNASFANKVSWVDPVGFIESRNDLTLDPQTDSFQLPTTQTSVVNGQTVDNRGIWRVHTTRNNGRLLETTLINVSDAQNPAAHLVVRKFAAGADPVDVGSNVKFIITLANKGPDAATTVHLTDPTPGNLTLVSFTQTSGPSLACTGADCTIASLAVGESAEFVAEYTVNSSTAGGTVIENTAVVTSPVSDPDDTERSATGSITVVNNANQATCALECPGNITVTANATQGTESGAFVTFGAAEPSGDCGAISATPASGSFFATGSHTVTVSSATGGGSCSFIVSVVDVAAPTITCPLPDLTGTASGGSLEASVTVSTPAGTGNNVSVTGTRSDNRTLTDTYPVGTTIINWVATEHFNGEPGRTASCSQKVIVTSPDAPTITCPADKSFTASDCTGMTLTASDIGTPSTTGVNVTVAGRRSDSLDLYNDPYPVGTTFITWTATDDFDRVVSCIQRISVGGANDTTPPTLHVPASISLPTSSCSVLLDDELGVATAEDSCSSAVTISRTGIPTVACPTPGDPNRQCESFFFPTGTTVITYTATDGSGNVTTGTQTVTLTETPAIPPTITAPADLNLTTGAGATSCGLLVSDGTLGTAVANDNCPGVTVARSGVPAGNMFPVGTTMITYTATDRSGNTATDTQTVTVTDNTVPTITAPAAVTLYTGIGATSCSVTVADLDLTLGTATAADNCPGVTWARGSSNVFPLGNTTVTYTATDAAGNTATATQVVTVIDNTPPVVTPPANITVQLPLNSTATSMAVTYPNPATATDNCAGTITFVYSPASGSTFPVGPTTVTVTATDAHGNSATATFTVTVLYNFTGFFAPVDNLPSFNEMKAGQAVPLKFSLSGNKGLNIFATGSPNSVQIGCTSGDPVNSVEETLTAGSSTLTYDAASDRYHYVWKTESAWKNTCRQLNVVLNDGSTHSAKFKFK